METTMITNTNEKDNRLLETLKNAIISDHHSKSAYTGRVIQKETVTIITEDGTPYEKEVSFLISWDSISEILGLVRKRSGL